MKRRTFLKVLGASGAATATVGCSTGEVEKLVPFVVPPEEIVPGVPTYYSTTCRECPAGCGLHVETHEGRATKVEGNPEHPISHGNTCLRGQASVQGLYHPDRYTGPLLMEFGVDQPRNVSWSQAERVVAEEIRRAPRGSVVFLTSGYRGSLDTLVDQFVAANGIRRVDWAPLEDTPRDLDFADADLLVSFGADFLETWGSPVHYAWQFSQQHGYRNGRRGRFVWVGPHRPLTGLNADLWIQTRPGTEALVAQALAGGDLAQVAAQTGDAEQTQQRAAALQTLQQWWGEAGRKVAMGPGASVQGPNSEVLRQAVDRLNGRTTPPPADARPLQQLIQQMNAGQVRVVLLDGSNPVYTVPGGLKFREALAKVPVRVSFSTFPDDTSRMATHLLPQSHFLERWDDYVPAPGVFELVQPVMKPVFNTKAMGEIVLGLSTALGQAPAAGATDWLGYLRAAWAGRAGSPDAWRAALKRGGVFPAGSTGTQALGFVTQPAAAAQTTQTSPATTTPAQTADSSAAPAAAAAPVQAPAPVPATPTPAPARTIGPVSFQPPRYEGPADGLHLVVYPSHRFFDGRTGNRPWLLELADPVTKVSWASWAEMHPDTARKLGVEQGDEVEIQSPHGSVTTRVYVYPGVIRDTVAIQMGLGHEDFGRWNQGMGVNPMRLLGSIDAQTGAVNTAGVKVSVTPTGSGNIRRAFPRGLVEQGVRVQHDRAIAKAIGLSTITRLDQSGPAGILPHERQLIEELKGAGGFVPEPVQSNDPAAAYPPPGTEYGEYIDNDTRWAMVIDLAKCIGCASCVIACQAENNIPVVGPHEVLKGRELHWLRIERYWGVSRQVEEAYQDDATDDTRFLPMLCQHCGQAPCEPVCPVYAAYHTPDGLNGQVYNRCVGTRYCAQNCPWKVRVFNWFTYEFAEPMNWQLNPDVTVREKGVMEKCTFCVQRIHEAERGASAEGRPVRDGEVTPACVQTCPTEVFVFGNMSDPNSAVSQAAHSHRGYRALGELNTHTAIVYLSKVTLHEPRNGGHGAWPAAEGGSTEHMPQGGQNHGAAEAQQGGH
ncbi:molybdopterin dinucleotide binding domain-containing protein [Longimicrobium sp.]|uniref:molybdopterin dinucleotide binding domain-containing protein n=1 Tax=Longimicrobium sp. TaxID=2029185 RepID=UPI002E37A7B6|nr:molybdopterin dinucleotide binding domain-containing protein [Longimicrobium sp.]